MTNTLQRTQNFNLWFQPENSRFEVRDHSSRTSWHAQWLSCCKNTSGWRPWYQERLVLKFPNYDWHHSYFAQFPDPFQLPLQDLVVPNFLSLFVVYPDVKWASNINKQGSCVLSVSNTVISDLLWSILLSVCILKSHMHSTLLLVDSNTGCGSRLQYSLSLLYPSLPHRSQWITCAALSCLNIDIAFQQVSFKCIPIQYGSLSRSAFCTNSTLCRMLHIIIFLFFLVSVVI